MDKIFEKYIKDSDKEIEVRFGKFSRTFMPGVTRDQFNRIFEFLKTNEKFYTYSKVEQKIEKQKNIRKITEKNKTKYSKKTKIENLDVKDWGFRLSVASEEDVDKQDSFSADLIVERTRHSFVNKTHKTRFDLDISSEYGADSDFTVELECLTGCKFEDLKKDIDMTIKILQEARFPIPNSVVNSVIKKYGQMTKGRRFAGVQPMTLSGDKFDKKENYAITKKLDGRRFLMMCLDGKVFTISSNMGVNLIPYSYKDKSLEDYIFDTELFRGYYHIFDIAYPGTGTLLDRVRDINNILPKFTRQEGEKQIVTKEYFFTENLENTYKIFKEQTNNLNSDIYDGLILVKQDKVYKKSAPLKWKPVNMNTIDFQIGKNDNSMLDLYVGDTGDKLKVFTSIKVSKKDYNMYNNGDIVEFSYDGKDWVPLKKRHDKVKPNFHTVAEDNFQAVLSPFSPEETFNYRNALYNLRRFHNYIKRVYISKYRSKSVLDMACGKGGDFGKYLDSGFSRIDGYDIDEKSIKEAKSRSMKMTKNNGNNIEINIKLQDLNKNVIAPGNVKFDVVVCNFAFHYFYKNLDKFLESVKNNLKKKGHLLLSFFDGDLLKEMSTGDYEIKKLGQEKVSVWMKDSVLNKPETEYIVDIKKVVSLFEKNGIVMIENENFKNKYKKWNKMDSKNRLTDDEMALSFMNVSMVFQLA